MIRKSYFTDWFAHLTHLIVLKISCRASQLSLIPCDRESWAILVITREVNFYNPACVAFLLLWWSLLRWEFLEFSSFLFWSYYLKHWSWLLKESRSRFDKASVAYDQVLLVSVQFGSFFFSTTWEFNMLTLLHLIIINKLRLCMWLRLGLCLVSETLLNGKT